MKTGILLSILSIKIKQGFAVPSRAVSSRRKGKMQLAGLSIGDCMGCSSGDGLDGGQQDGWEPKAPAALGGSGHTLQYSPHSRSLLGSAFFVL